jgi:hypothetical protein
VTTDQAGIATFSKHAALDAVGKARKNVQGPQCPQLVLQRLDGELVPYGRKWDKLELLKFVTAAMKKEANDNEAKEQVKHEPDEAWKAATAYGSDDTGPDTGTE